MDDYLLEMESAVREIHRVLKPPGSFYLHCDWHASHYLKVMCDRVFGYGNFKNDIAWLYKGAGQHRFWSRKHDSILFYTKTDSFTFNVEEVRLPYAESSLSAFKSRSKLGGELNPDRSHYADSKGRWPEDYFDIPSLKNTSERVGYPTQKPLALLERIIKASSNPGDIVLDPFCGGGTTLLAAEQLNRRWIGIDRNPNAVEISKKRLFI